MAKCGVFLKEKATHVEGIFRLSGSEKRIKELKTIFDSPDRYGKGLVWDGYTVHDAANVLRRYLNDLPEPVVPLDLYEKFREPLRGATRQAAGDADGPQFVENFDVNGAIARYQQLITELPPLNRQLLLYLLDLLAVFAAKSEENRMNSQNLAAIFQPGMLSHPNHAMAPEEYRLNQCVIIFLIENQDHFLIGMQGTAADEKTVREVQKGTTPSANIPATPDPNRGHSIHRSHSNASVGAESVAKEGMIRRNKSTSSRHSRQSRQSNGGRSPGSPAISTTPTGGGLGRSNTVPSKKSPGLQSGRFQNRHDPSSTPIAPLTPVTPHHVTPRFPPEVVEEVATSPEETPSAQRNRLGIGASTSVADRPEPGFLEPSAAGAATPSRERPLQSLFQRSPTGDSEKRAPNKLRKKKLPGSANPSAHSSTASLPHSGTASPSVEAPNPMDYSHSPLAITSPAVEAATQRLAADTTSESTPTASQVPSSNTLHPESAAEQGLRHQKSPPTSLHSSFNEGSDVDQQLDEQQGLASGQQQEDKERKRRWRLSRKREEGPTSNPSTSPRKTLGTNLNADVSTSSVGSSGADKPRRSFTGESPSNPNVVSTDALSNTSLTGTDSREGREESGRGLTGWIKNKYREAKETAEQRRNKSPSADRPNTLGPPTVLPARGKSLDISRVGEEGGRGQLPQEPKGEQQ